MAKFKQKKIVKGQGLSDRLKKTRLSKDITLAEAATATKVQIKYLEILESGDYSSLPGDIYAKVWLKAYADFLELPYDELIVEYKIGKRVSEQGNNFDNQLKKTKLPKENIFLKPRSIKLFFIALVVSALLGYIGWEIKNIIAPPTVNIMAPNNNFTTTDSQINIEGHTATGVELTINNERVLLDENGIFKQTINLAPGLNKLLISAKKKHSRTSYLEWNILRE